MIRRTVALLGAILYEMLVASDTAEGPVGAHSTELDEATAHEVNQKFTQDIEEDGLVFSGTSPDGNPGEFVESPERLYCVAT